MHGRVKVRSTAEQEALKNAERAKKLLEYKTAISLIFAKRKKGIWEQELLTIIGKMLIKNPDVTTLWNIRREVIEKTVDRNSEEYISLLNMELNLIEQCLRENSKSYSAWHHRCWVIDHLPEPHWQMELTLCSECLNKDERNFHCWDYRNYIVSKAKVSDEEEFKFSTTKIMKNFSNYSSWHYRSKILSKIFPDKNNELPIREDMHKEELDLVMNATFTDPNDSSAWFYQRWLLDCQRLSSPKKTIWGAQVTKDNATVIFHQEIQIDSSSNVLSLFLNEKQVNCQWKPAIIDTKFSKLWFTTFSKSLETINSINTSICIKIEGDILLLKKSDVSPMWFYKTKILETQFSQGRYNESQLREQLENYKQLSQMEPDNKWALLTGIFLMKNISFQEFYSDILLDINTLMKVDLLRLNYYKDLRSKYVIEYNLWKNENETDQRKINLSSLDLTTIYNEQYFGFFEEINLGANQLERSLNLLYSFQKCTKLSLSSNKIRSLKCFPTLQNLKILSLRNNEIKDVEELVKIVMQHNHLKQLDLRDNPICQTELLSKIANISPYLEVFVN